MTSLGDTLGNPLVRAVATVLVTALLVAIAVRATRSAVRAHVSDSELRYRASKLVSVAGYTIILSAIGDSKGRVVLASTTVQLVDIPTLRVSVASDGATSLGKEGSECNS